MNKPHTHLSGVSAFFPAYNDGGTIASMVICALTTLPKIADDYEVIVVNDGSQDYTAEVLQELARQYPQVRVIDHGENRGYGSALRTGFAAATKEWIFYTDGDAQYDPREVVLLANALQPDTDAVNGYKIVRHDPPHRVVVGFIFRRFARIAFGVRIRDVNCDFRLMRRSLLGRVTLESDTGAICVELVRKLQDAGARFAEVPVHHYARVYGRSQIFSFRRLWRIGLQLVALWWKFAVRRENLHSLKAARQSTIPDR